MNILKLFGLSDNHNAIYLALLEYGRLQPSAIARITNIKRPTVYLLLKDLEAGGFVKSDLRERGLTYLPTPPNELERLLIDEEKKLYTRKKELLDALPALNQSAKGRNYSDPKLRIISGGEIEKYLYDNTKLWLERLKSSATKTWWGFQDATFVDQFEKWIHWSWSITPKNITLNLLTNSIGKEKEMKGKYAQRHMKYLNSKEFSASQWVIGDRIIYIMTKQKPFYAIELVDPVIASNTEKIFKLLWESIDLEKSVK